MSKFADLVKTLKLFSEAYEHESWYVDSFIQKDEYNHDFSMVFYTKPPYPALFTQSLLWSKKNFRIEYIGNK